MLVLTVLFAHLFREVILITYLFSITKYLHLLMKRISIVLKLFIPTQSPVNSGMKTFKCNTIRLFLVTCSTKTVSLSRTFKGFVYSFRLLYKKTCHRMRVNPWPSPCDMWHVKARPWLSYCFYVNKILFRLALFKITL